WDPPPPILCREEHPITKAGVGLGRLGSSLAMLADRVSQCAWRVGGLLLPTAVVPEVLLGRMANVPLENVGVRGNDRIYVVLEVSGFRDGNVLDQQVITAVRLAERGAEHERRVEAEREHRRTARCLRWTSEEIHVCRRDVETGLIDEDADHAVVAQRARCAAHRFAIPYYG